MILCSHEEDGVLWAHDIHGQGWTIAADTQDELYQLIREGMALWFPENQGWWLVNAPVFGCPAGVNTS